MKTCSKCLLNKPISEFRVCNNKPHSYCTPCNKLYDRERFISKKELRKKQIKEQRERTRLLIREFKDGPCVDCKGRFHFSAMQFDHLPEFDKTGEVSTIAGRGCYQKALAEIKKCDLVCANCHAIRTWKRRNQILLVTAASTTIFGI